MPRSALAAVTNRLRMLRYNYLVLPAVIAVAFGGLAFALLAIERGYGPTGIGELFPAGAPAARAVLTTIAGSLATVVGVAFSVTIVTLQLVSQQYTPRAVRGFLGDRLIQTVAGVFVGVIVYCLVTLRAVEEGDEPFVGGLTVTVAFVLAVLALGMLLVFIHHVGRSIQASEITRRIAAETAGSLDQLYPESYGEPEEDEADALVAGWAQAAEPTVVFPAEPGFVQQIDDIPATLEGERFRVELLVAPGDFVTTGHPLARVWTEGDADACARAIRRAVAVAAERDLRQDVAYGIRQLADIAVKALSPSVNDPTTAATAIGYLQGIFEQLAGRSWPARVRRFPDREVTLVMRRDAFEPLLEALVQIGRYATDARIVVTLLGACLRIRDAARDADARERAAATERCGARIADRALRGGELDHAERAEVEELRVALGGTLSESRAAGE